MAHEIDKNVTDVVRDGNCSIFLLFTVMALPWRRVQSRQSHQLLLDLLDTDHDNEPTKCHSHQNGKCCLYKLRVDVKLV